MQSELGRDRSLRTHCQGTERPSRSDYRPRRILVPGRGSIRLSPTTFHASTRRWQVDPGASAERDPTDTRLHRKTWRLRSRRPCCQNVHSVVSCFHNCSISEELNHRLHRLHGFEEGWKTLPE